MGHGVAALRANDVGCACLCEEGVDGHEQLLMEGDEVEAVANDYYLVLLPQQLRPGGILQ